MRLIKNKIKRKKDGRMPVSVKISIIVLAVIITASLISPLIARHDPTKVDLLNKFQPCCGEYWFGTDDYGRCTFCKVLYAIRTSLGIALLTEGLSVVIGTLIGIFSAYIGGKVDYVINLICEALLSFPSLILTMVIVAFLGASTQNIIIAMLMSNWIWYARIARGMALSLKERKYVQAAEISGGKAHTIVFRHITPGVVTQMIAQFTLAIGNTILGLAGFSFLGIGVQRPTPELGVMISDACGLISTNFMVFFWPSIVLFIIVLGFNIIGDYINSFFQKTE